MQIFITDLRDFVRGRAVPPSLCYKYGMRYAVLSDIHANLEAFRAVLDRIAGLRVDRIANLGDSVGYNPNPNECLEIIRSEGIVSVLGNHDAVAAGIEEPENFNPYARHAALWTREQLTPENRDFLRSLPRERQIDRLFLCHGSIHDTDRYILYQNDVRDNFVMLAALPGRPHLLFLGHSHIQMAFSSEGRIIEQARSDRISVYDSKLYLINPGSVGQPRDGDPDAAFAVYDSDKGVVSFLRTEYDIPATQDKIIRAGLPPRLAERLSVGR